MGVTANHSLTILSKDASTNTAQVRYLVQITTSGDSWQGYTQTGNFNIDGVAYTNQYTLPKNTTTIFFDKTVTISNASGKTVTASYSCYTTPTFRNTNRRNFCTYRITVLCKFYRALCKKHRVK